LKACKRSNICLENVTPFSTPLIIYQVSATVPQSIAPQYREWISPHVEQILALENNKLFKFAELFEEEDFVKDEKEKTVVVFTVHYHIETREQLNKYFAEYAPALRADGAKWVEKGVTFSRQILERLQAFKGIPQTKEFGYVF